MRDKINWKAKWSIHKFNDPDGKVAEFLRNGGSLEEAAERFKLFNKEEWKDNVALNEGLQAIIDMICGLATITAWDNTNARLGVGDDPTAPAATQTGLLGVNQAFVGMDSGYPVRVGQEVEWRATFGDGVAEFAWEEYTVDNGSVALQNLNRATASKGTKAAGESWTLSLKITFS